MLVTDDNHEHHHVHTEALHLVYPLLEMFLLHHSSIFKPRKKTKKSLPNFIFFLKPYICNPYLVKVDSDKIRPSVPSGYVTCLNRIDKMLRVLLTTHELNRNCTEMIYQNQSFGFIG